MPRILPEKEKRLLSEAGKGNEQSFTELFYAYKDKLYGFVLRMSGNREIAEDVVQDVFMKIWERRGDLIAVENFNAFLFRISRNHTINVMRRMAKETLVLRETRQRSDPAAPPPDEALIYKNMRQTLNAIVSALPRQQKAVYQLSREESLRQDEIAQKLHISLPTVKNHMAQALRTIREKFGKYYLNLIVVILLALMYSL